MVLNIITISLPKFDSSSAPAQAWATGTAAWRLKKKILRGVLFYKQDDYSYLYINGQHPPVLLGLLQILRKMNDPPEPTFSGLPTELKTKVLSYIAGKADRKAFTLVSYECNKIMAPIQWYTLTLKVGDKTPGELDILLRPRKKTFSVTSVS